MPELIEQLEASIEREMVKKGVPSKLAQRRIREEQEKLDAIIAEKVAKPERDKQGVQDVPLLGTRSLIAGNVETVRSFSYKLNVGNYESRDFFCSQKAESRPADSSAVSELLYSFCKQQVMKAVREYKEAK